MDRVAVQPLRARFYTAAFLAAGGLVDDQHGGASALRLHHLGPPIVV
jgi:hypothetical protein